MLMLVSYTSSDSRGHSQYKWPLKVDMAWTQQDCCYVNGRQQHMSRQYRVAAAQKSYQTALAKATSSAPHGHPPLRHMQISKGEMSAILQIRSLEALVKRN